MPPVEDVGYYRHSLLTLPHNHQPVLLQILCLHLLLHLFGFLMVPLALFQP